MSTTIPPIAISTTPTRSWPAAPVSGVVGDVGGGGGGGGGVDDPLFGVKSTEPVLAAKPFVGVYVAANAGSAASVSVRVIDAVAGPVAGRT